MRKMPAAMKTNDIHGSHAAAKYRAMHEAQAIAPH
jgi:hypothetical protein